MVKAYPPVWCKGGDCKKCDLNECNERSLNLILPYRDVFTPPEKKGTLEITALAVYLGFCPKLAEFFLQFPAQAPIPVIYSNFINSHTGKPTSQPIHRILLDILASTDPTDLTDDIYKYRLLFFSTEIGKKYRLETKDGIKEFKFKFKDKFKMTNKLQNLHEQFIDGVLLFPPTVNKKKCQICIYKKSCK
jgi:hypothetical protein